MPKQAGKRGFAFVVFTEITMATAAMRALDTKPFLDRPLQIAYAFRFLLSTATFLAYVFSWVTIFVEVQISEILSRVAAWLNLIGTLRCRQLVIVTISKILTVAHI